MINLTLFTPPAVEPVTLDEARTHLRVDLPDDNGLIESLVAAARQHAETVLGRALIDQTWDWTIDDWPELDQAVPRPPLQSVTHIKYFDAAGVQQTLATTVYQVDAKSTPGRIALKDGQIWPPLQTQKLAAIEVRFVAGYGNAAASVPQPIRQAMLLLIGHWYATREAVNIGNIVTPLPMSVDALLAPHRDMRF